MKATPIKEIMDIREGNMEDLAYALGSLVPIVLVSAVIVYVILKVIRKKKQ